MYKLYLIILILLFSVSCLDDRQIRIDYSVKFNDEVEVSLDTIKVPSVLLKERKIIANNKYLISTNTESDTLFRVFNLSDHAYVGSFGFKGRGPHDFYHANVSGFRPIKNGCIVTDMRYVNVIEFPNGMITNDKVHFKQQYSIPGQLIPFNHAVMINDSMICGEVLIGSPKELTYYNPQTKMIGNLIDFPKTTINAPENVLPQLFQKRIGISNDKSKIVFAYWHFPLIRIFSANGAVLHEVFVEEGPPQKKIRFNKHGINGMELYGYYYRVVATDKYIYALFEPSEFRKKYKEGGEYIAQPIEKKQMHIFDWEGNPKIKVILQDWMITFTPTLDDNYIYFVHPNHSDRLYRFTLFIKCYEN